MTQNKHLPFGYNKDAPVVRIDGVCYVYKGPSTDEVDTTTIEETFETCTECETPEPSPSP